MSTENDNKKNGNLPISDVKQRVFKCVQEILGDDIVLTDTVDWHTIDDLDWIEIIMEVEKDFDCSNKIDENSIDYMTFDTMNELTDWLVKYVA